MKLFAKICVGIMGVVLLVVDAIVWLDSNKSLPMNPEASWLTSFNLFWLTILGLGLIVWAVVSETAPPERDNFIYSQKRRRLG